MAKAKPMTAAEVIAQRANDPAYQEMRRKQDQELAERTKALEKESELFAKECAEVGYEIKTPWDLVQTNERYPLLVPILLRYLANPNYSARFREGAGRALATPDSSIVFDELLNLFKLEVSNAEGVRWAIACALSVAAQKEEDFDCIEKLILNQRNGQDRSALLGAVKRMSKEQRERVLSFARGDSELKSNLGVYKLR